MIIYAKRRFEFKRGEERFVVPRLLDFIQVPDWVAQTDLYKLAISSGDIQYVGETPIVTPPAAKPPKPKKSKKANTTEAVEEVLEDEGEPEAEETSEGANHA